MVLRTATWALVVLASSTALAQEDDDYGEDFFDEDDAFDEEYGSEGGSGDPSAEGDAAPADGEPATDGSGGGGYWERDPAWSRGYRAMPTLGGSVGGFHVADGGSASPRSLRLLFATDFFATSDFFREGDGHNHVGGWVSGTWSITDPVEVFASLRSTSNSNDAVFPNLLQALSDTTVGAKVFTDVSPIVDVAGELSLLLPTGADLGVGFASVGLRVRANLTVDLRDLDDPAPVLLRANLGYRLDNTRELVTGIEAERYAALGSSLGPSVETAHLVTRAERFGLGIYRQDAVELALGFEAPLDAGSDVWIAPILEWRWGIPVDRQGYVCPFIPAAPGSDAPIAGDDGCLANTGLVASPMDLTLGVRVLPPVRGFAAFIALDIGLLGTSFEDAVRELPQNEPWDLIIGVAYAFDLRPDPVEPEPIVRVRVEREEVAPEVAPRGVILGRVVDKATRAPVDGAVVRYTNRDRTSQVTDGAGQFRSDALEPGPVAMDASREGYTSGTCSAEIPSDGGEVLAECEVERVLVVVQESSIEILEQIHFDLDSDVILPDSFTLMQHIADAIVNNPQIRRIEIQGHTDDQGTPEYNLDLSQRRASSVRRWLTEHGVAEARLIARGYGESRPLVPDTTEEARARNRRVQFIITDRAP